MSEMGQVSPMKMENPLGIGQPGGARFSTAGRLVQHATGFATVVFSLTSLAIRRAADCPVQGSRDSSCRVPMLRLRLRRMRAIDRCSQSHPLLRDRPAVSAASR